jgi:hypothetical protein
MWWQDTNFFNWGYFTPCCLGLHNLQTHSPQASSSFLLTHHHCPLLLMTESPQLFKLL